MSSLSVRLILTALVAVTLDFGKEENIFHVDIVSSLDAGRDIEMVTIPGGTFTMGSTLFPVLFIDTIIDDPFTGELIVDTTQNTERPVHFVSLSPFMISSTEITQEQYLAVIGANPSHFMSESNLPVENVSWFNAAGFCNELSKIMGYQPCYDMDFNCDFSADGFRLPTESEWEYAARAGTTSEYSNGGDPESVWQIAWYAGNSELKSRPVATKQPNEAGLHDMHGNVSEWCQDYYNYYNCNSQTDPSGPVRGVFKVARSGSWAGQEIDCRSAIRYAYLPASNISTLGFRIVRRR